MSTQLAAPNLTAEVIDRTKIEVSGLDVANASGYEVKIGTLSGGMPARSVTPVEGKATFSGLYPRSVYYISARALGDDEEYANSDWSDEISILTGTVIDSDLAVPNIEAATETFTTLKITGLTPLEEYRYQIATTAASVENAPVRNIGSADGSAYIRGLDPGTVYYVRVCLVDAGRCSLWSDVVSGTTEAVSNTIEVTSGGDSGTGTLRQAVADAVNGTKILLNVDAVTLDSVISNTSKRIFIVGGKTARTVIQPGSGNALLAVTYMAGRHLRFTGDVGSASAITNGHFDDCAIDGIITTGSDGFAKVAGFSSSEITNCKSGLRALNAGVHCDTIISGCSATGTNADGGGVYGAVLNNCIVRNCSTVRNGGGAYNCTAVNCAFVANSSPNTGGGVNSGTYISCAFIGNTAATEGGAGRMGTYKRCYIIGNATIGGAASNGGGGLSSATAIQCMIVGNHCGMSNQQGGGTWQTSLRDCLVYDNTYAAAHYANDTASAYNVVTEIRSSTIGVAHVGTPANLSMYNTLYKSRSATPTGADVCNLSYSGSESAYFIDADHGDYRLGVNSPAIGAGDNQYVTTETDLAGNPRIGGANVDVGAYEFEAYRLDPPVFSLTPGDSGACEIEFSIPASAAAFLLQYANSADFSDARQLSSASAGIALSGLSGRVYFRGRSVGTPGLTLDSDWTEAQDAYFDVTAPIVIVDRSPIEMTFGDEVNLLAGVVVSDDSGGGAEPHYQVLDRDDSLIAVDGETIDIRTSGIPRGNYKLVISAADAAGNVGSADRGLAVLPPKLDTPVLTIKSVAGRNVVLAGLVDVFASGWRLEHNGSAADVTPDRAGYLAVNELAENVTHVFRARAVGDFVQPQPPAPPSGDHRSSDWSAAVTVTILPPQPPVGAFWQWRAAAMFSKDGRIRQDAALRARIFDARTGELLPPTAVAGAVFTAWRLAADGTRVPVTGFDSVAVPNSAFGASADEDGYNFAFVPDQSLARLLAAPGRYVLSVAVTVAGGNPFDVCSDVITVY